MEYDNTNRGAIWKNDDKQSEKHPDYKGSINATCPHCNKGSDFWLSAWGKKADANPRAPVLSLSVNPKEEAHKQGMEQVAQDTGIAPDNFNDSIPF